jgi:hypothetical protein
MDTHADLPSLRGTIRLGVREGPVQGFDLTLTATGANQIQAQLW